MKRTILALCLAGRLSGAEAPVPAKVEFNRDVRPILADTCFRCHGFDKNTREADLRLDVREAAIAKIDDIFPIVPGKPDASEAWRRIVTTDKDDLMPPKKANRQLSPREKEIIRKWIEQGAEYQPHWAYAAPAKQAPPAVNEPGFSRTVVDQFVLARHRELGLKHSPEADRVTLCRRLHLDLLGIPPTQAEVDAFVKDTRPDAVEKLVDRLLASPRYGERMAVLWLDLVRYADSTGYHSDNPRNVWPYRDYVIRAFNDNMPFDRFTVEQVAGDLLPGATFQQKIASGYNRLTLTTEEGGAQAKEYEAKSVTDRVKSIGTTWLAQTFMCSECHDHKFDPVTQRDFYSLGAFFADVKESAIGKREDGMAAPTVEQEERVKEFDAKLATLQKLIDAGSPEIDRAQADWERMVVTDAASIARWVPLHPVDLKGTADVKLAVEGGEIIRAEGGKADAETTYRIDVKGNFKNVTGFRLEALASTQPPKKGQPRRDYGAFALTEFSVERMVPNAAPELLKIGGATATFEQAAQPAGSAIDGNSKDRANGWRVAGGPAGDHAIYLELARPISADGEQTLAFVMHFEQGGDRALGRFRLATTTAPRGAKVPKHVVPAEVAEALTVESGSRTPPQKAQIAAHYRTISPALAAARGQLAEARKQRTDLEKSFGRCLVTERTDQMRTVRILPRGDWMNTTGEVVQPATPAYLPGAPKPPPGGRLTRLDLARWIVSRENPLTARVFVNRLWKQFYGVGIAKALEDIGTQGELPVNQPLLDWLAVEFMDSGWNVKHVVRLMVTSGIYRQSSRAAKEMIDRDPHNRELARQSRWRLDAEFVRDNALSVAGLVVHKLGGPSVKPYQPDGYWENLNFPVRKWEDDKGENQWRRGLYTWWQRSYLHPAMLAFDAPTREECAADRVRSNIPQQALVLLNDPEYFEAARAFGARILKEGGATPEARIEWAWREATGRAPVTGEVEALRALLARCQDQIAKDPSSADKLLKVGMSPPPKDIPAAELASYTSVARAILNLHETVSRL